MLMGKPEVSIDILPDDVFLEIFAFCAFFYSNTALHMRQWQHLVQVCQRWRQIIYSSPRYLDLLLYCSKTGGIPVKNLSSWPAFPISMCYDVPGDEDDAIAVLKHSDRVRLVELRIMSPQWGKVAAAMLAPFPVLTHLELSALCEPAVVLPSGFSGGSAPCLQNVVLYRIPFPGLPTLLLSARDLVSLHLMYIPPTGYVLPEAMVACLAVLTRLEKLCIVFSGPPIYQSRRCSDLPMRVVLPALTDFQFGGRNEYLDDLVAEIDAPRLHGVHTDVDRLDFLPVPQLFLFIGRTENLRFRRVQVDFTDGELRLELRVDPWRHYGTLRHHLGLNAPIDWSGTHVAHIALVLTQIFTMCSDVDYLHIITSDDPLGWHDDIDSTEWLTFFRLFPTVKTMHVVGMLAVQAARALEDVPEEMVTKVLPSLLSLILESKDPEELISAEHFVSLRRLNGRPVTMPLDLDEYNEMFEEV